MSFTNLLTDEVIVSRLETVSGIKTEYSTVTLEDVSIQRMAEERLTGIGGAIGKTFRMYTKENADILVGDKLVDNDTGAEYKIIAITKPAGLGNFVHQECIIDKVK